MTSRFDLEQEILTCWGVVDDLKFYISTSDTWTEDERMNFLIGISVKYDKKFNQLFQVFEDMIKDDFKGSPASTMPSFLDPYDEVTRADILD